MGKGSTHPEVEERFVAHILWPLLKKQEHRCPQSSNRGPLPLRFPLAFQSDKVLEAQCTFIRVIDLTARENRSEGGVLVNKDANHDAVDLWPAQSVSVKCYPLELNARIPALEAVGACPT